MPEAIAYIGLGSNLGDSAEQLRRAGHQLACLPHTRFKHGSHFYRTAPIGYTDQPDFLNAVARLATGVDPEALIRHLLAIETAFGRVRHIPGGPRTLDLDLLLYYPAGADSALVLERPGLRLPHPRLHERAFVLYPLAEIAPDIAIPGRGPIRHLLAGCADQRVERTDMRFSNGESLESVS